MKTKRIMAGLYEVQINGRTFRIENVRHEVGLNKPLWHVSEKEVGCSSFGPPFDAAETLAEAKRWVEVAATNDNSCTCMPEDEQGTIITPSGSCPVHGYLVIR